MAHSEKRRLQLIDPRFQFRMVAAFLGLQLLVSVLFALALAFFFRSELDANLASAHAKVQNLSSLLLPIVIVLTLTSFLVSTVFITVFVVRLSHRLAGPMFRFRVTLDALAHRTLPSRTALRPGDQFQEVATSLAAALETVGEDLATFKQATSAAQDSLGTGNLEEARRHLQSLTDSLDRWSPGP